MKKYTYILLLVIAVLAVMAFNKKLENTQNEVTETTKTPPSAKKNNSFNFLPAALTDREEQIVEHTGYTLSYNKDFNTPNWSAWELTAEHTNGQLARNTKFYADPKINRLYRVDYYEYKGSGYDRGHMCPAGDMKWSADAMHDCFYMSNMCPQNRTLDDGAWKKLEQECRRWTKKEGTLYIVCGPIYTENARHERIGIEHSIYVPERFFKVVLSLRSGKEKAIGFIFNNNDEMQTMKGAAMSVDEVEATTGLDFFPELDDTQENAIESKYDLKEWR